MSKPVIKAIRTVGVVGAGTMGSALAQKFAQEGFRVILADKDHNSVENGLKRIRLSLEEGVEKKVFSKQQADHCLASIRGCTALKELALCDLVLEAIYENFDAKEKLFTELSSIVAPDTILATNTSSFSITELSAAVTGPERFIGLHFFYHAAKNRLVEIIPGERSSAATISAVYRFAAQAGKDPIYSKDAYGFVVNRFFVPWLNEAVRLFHEGLAPIEAIEHICRETFSIGMGPFELMNATGISVAYHAEKTLEIFGHLYKVSDLLKDKACEGGLWEWDKSGDPMSRITSSTAQEIRERMLGVVFLICSEILDEKVCSVAEIDRGAKIGLRWKKGPVELMRETGENEVIRLVVKISDIYRMDLPLSVGEKFWKPEYIRLEIKGTDAVIRIDQPEALNALSEPVVEQLASAFHQADSSPGIKRIILTGAGKAFVAGADIRFFLRHMKNNRLNDIEHFTRSGQQLFDRIDRSEKQVVALLNGMALGGGLELALCADLIYAVPKAIMGFPETGIGIYPGLGGTQRPARRIGTGLTKYLVLSGKILSAAEAETIGMIDGVISIEELHTILSGGEVPAAATPAALSKHWQALKGFFENNALADILKRNYSAGDLEAMEAEKLSNTLRSKAPLALNLADRLISEGKGCASELDHLKEIFSTHDALIGLSSIGKKPVFTGR